MVCNRSPHHYTEQLYCTALYFPHYTVHCTVFCWVQVYRGQQLAWAAQLELVPVAVRVTSLRGVRGMIVALDETGGLEFELQN
jgi:hypothetical protein